MIRIPGIFKVSLVLTVDFINIYALTHNVTVGVLLLFFIALYVWLGGYLTLFKEGAVRIDKIPACERSRLEKAKSQLIQDVKYSSSVDISRLKLYLIAGDYDMQATAYGANCVSVSRGTLNQTDSLTLNGVLGHEISHILNLDPEFNRAILASILLICGVLSLVSWAFMLLIFLIFLFCSFFQSWTGIMAYRGTTKAVAGIFSLLQKGIVVIYSIFSGLLNRRAEFRADRYSAQLGYGVQLAHFLTYGSSESHRQLSLVEALYRSHPSTPRRVARLEAFSSRKI